MSNLLEFALNGSPVSGASQGLSFGQLATVDATPGVLTLTVAVRADAAFVANGNRMEATSTDGVSYSIEGSGMLLSWGDLAVIEVTGDDALLIQSAFPAPDAGWSYRTFRISGDISTEARGFMRVVVE